MATTCNSYTAVTMANNNDTVVTVPSYEPNIGAPFKVVLVNSVRQRLSPEGELLETVIPNLSGLLKEIAFARALDRRKFNPDDIKFVRKAVGLKALDLAELLGVSPEHISRCENGERTLSIAAEKLLRVIVLKKRHNPASLANAVDQLLSSENVDAQKIRFLKTLIEKYRTTVEELETTIFDFSIESVHSAGATLQFSFHIVTSDTASEFSQDEEENWEEEKDICQAA